MRFQVGRVDHDDLLLTVVGGQPLHHPSEHPYVAPSLLAVIKRLRRAILPWGVAPAQAIAIDENDAAQNTPVVDTRLAMALREKRPEPVHLLVGQPKKGCSSLPPISSRV